jgi:hypothetical protein
VSGWVIRVILPKDHPGIRHPVDPAASAEPEKTAS